MEKQHGITLPFRLWSFSYIKPSPRLQDHGPLFDTSFNSLRTVFLRP